VEINGTTNDGDIMSETQTIVNGQPKSSSPHSFIYSLFL